MALSPLWLGLVLLGALLTQAQDSTRNLIPAPPLFRIPVQPRFQNEQFQGKWYVIGVSGNENNIIKDSQLKMSVDTYERNKDNTYKLISETWGLYCDHETKIIEQNLHVDQLIPGDIHRDTGPKRYETRVVITDYNQFAIVRFKNVFDNQMSIRVTLYGRTKELPPVPKEMFISFTKSMGFIDQHIVFTLPNDPCINK